MTPETIPPKRRRCQVDPEDGRRTATAVFRVLRRALREKRCHVRTVASGSIPPGLPIEATGWIPSDAVGAPTSDCLAWFEDKVSLLDIRCVRDVLSLFASEADELAARKLSEVTLGRHLYAAGLVAASKASSWTPETPHMALTGVRVFPGAGRRKVWPVPTQRLVQRLQGTPARPSDPVAPSMPLWDRPAPAPEPQTPPPPPSPAGPTPFDAAMADVCRHMESARLALEAVPRPGPASAPVTALGWARAETLARGRSRRDVIRELQQALAILTDEIPD